MKGLIFIIIVTIVVLASFARPEKETSSSPSLTPAVSSANINKTVRDSIIILKPGS